MQMKQEIDYKTVNYDYGTVLNYLRDIVFEGQEYALRYQKRDYAKEYWFLYNSYTGIKKLTSIIVNNPHLKEAKDILLKYNILNEDVFYLFFNCFLRSVFDGSEVFCLYNIAFHDLAFADERNDVLKQCTKLYIPKIKIHIEPERMEKYYKDSAYWSKYPNYRGDWVYEGQDKEDKSFHYYRQNQSIRR